MFQVNIPAPILWPKATSPPQELEVWPPLGAKPSSSENYKILKIVIVI